MKKVLLLFATISFTATLNAQDWNTAGNTVAAGDYLGTNNNQPLNIRTAGIGRLRINPNLTSGTTVAAGNLPKNGFVGINTNDPWSRLHIVNGLNSICAGYRAWMREGLNIQTNDDMLWFGHRRWGATNPDQQNAMINWSDDPLGGAGPDHLVFNFTESSYSNPTYPAPGVNPSGSTLNGREVMRLTNLGNVGIGPRFDNNFIPQSTLHQHQENDASSWMQISNQYMTATGGNANTAPTFVNTVDGLRWGILGDAALNRNGNAFIYNQENRHLIFSTGNATPTNINTTRERFRITAVQNPTELVGGGYGIYNPWGVVGRITRTSISRDPNAPVVRPMAMLHLGYDYNTANTFGWRSWMDIGTMYLSNSNDHMYVGLKQESPGQNDAVVSWGKNTNPGAYEHLRFIFSSTVGNSAGANGLEIARMWSDGNIGRTGFGDFLTLAIEPQNTVHINGTALNDQTPGGVSGLRFQDLTSNTPTIFNPGPGVLAVDANGDVIYVDAPVGTGIGNFCGQPQMPLTNDFEIPLANFNYVFTGQGATGNNVGIGTNCTPQAKLDVRRTNVSSGNSQTIGVFIENSDDAVNNCMGIQSRVTGASQDSYGHYAGVTGAVNNNFGGYFETFGNADYNTGVRGAANTGNIINAAFDATASGTGSSSNYGYRSYTYGTTTGFNFGIQSQVTGGAINYGAWEQVYGPANANFGVYANASGATNNYGVFAIAPNTSPTLGPDYAGFFSGDLAYTGQFGFASDFNLKQNINDLVNATDIIEQLSPKTFEFQTANYSYMNLSEGNQYGLIAQDVETILPDLVNENVFPALYDTNGVQTSPAVSFKTVDYVKLIPILIQGSKEQIHTIDSLETIVSNQDSINNALQDQINTLYGMITACCSNNSNMGGNSMQNQNTPQTLDITLNDAPSIVLDQNVPNPFAEQTTITYTLVDGVQKAQMLFYNIEGKLIQSVNLIPTGGKGQINVFANDLSTGIYTYTLVVDGEIKGTKRMVKE